MIEGIYGWLRNITCYMLFMSVLDNLLPGKKYGKYLRLFAGMVLILLVVQPFTGGLRLEDRIAHYYEAFVFRYQAEDLKQELLGVEQQRLEQMIGQYEEAVEQDLSVMAEDAGLKVLVCQATICRETESEAFGTVDGIRLEVALAQGTEHTKTATQKDSVEPVKQVEPVRIGEAQTQEETPPADRKRQEEERAAVAKLRRKIASYYNLEESYVEIQVVEGAG